MKRRRIMALLAAVVVVMAVVVIVRPWGREPVCRGKKLSEWLEVAEREDPASAEYGPGEGYSRLEPGEWFELVEQAGPNWAGYREATRALREIGARGLPKMLKWLRYENAPWRRKVSFLIAKMPRWITGVTGLDRFGDETGGTRATRAATYFFCLGPAAQSAVPELTRMMNDPRRGDSADRAIVALAGLGSVGFGPLMTALGDPAHPHRITVAQVVPEIRGTVTNGNPAVPVLVGFLRDTNWIAAFVAAKALGQLKLDPALTVPALAASLEDPVAMVRLSAVEALREFGPQATSAAPALLKVLNDPNQGTRITATNALRKVAPETWEQMLEGAKAKYEGQNHYSRIIGDKTRILRSGGVVRRQRVTLGPLKCDRG